MVSWVGGWRIPHAILQAFNQMVFQKKFGKSLEQVFDDTKYQLMHLEMFPHGIIHAECVGGEIDLLLNRRVQIGFFPWRFVDGESSIGRCVAFVEDGDCEHLVRDRGTTPKTSFGDAYDPAHVARIEELSRANLS